MTDGGEAMSDQSLTEARGELQKSVDLLINHLERLQQSSTLWSIRLKAKEDRIDETLADLRKLSPTIAQLAQADVDKARSTLEEATVCYQGMVRETPFSGWSASVVGPALVVWVLGLAVAMAANYKYLRTDDTLYTVVYCICGGGLGGAAGALRDLIYYSGKRLYDPAWGQSYLLRPVLGAIMGVVAYTLLQAGLLVASQGTEVSSSAYAYFSIAFVGGFAVEQMAKKLYDIAETTFAVSGQTKQGG
jgi:hypothetical protein